MSKRFKEQTTGRMTGTLVDETGAAVAAASLSAMTLTLYDLDTGQILNSRDAQDVLNANNVTIDSSGALVWTLQPADNAIVHADQNEEVHRALFQWTWTGGKKGKHYEDLIVENLSKVV